MSTFSVAGTTVMVVLYLALEMSSRRSNELATEHFDPGKRRMALSHFFVGGGGRNPFFLVFTVIPVATMGGNHGNRSKRKGNWAVPYCDKRDPLGLILNWEPKGKP